MWVDLFAHVEIHKCVMTYFVNKCNLTCFMGNVWYVCVCSCICMHVYTPIALHGYILFVYAHVRVLMYV